MDTDAAPAAKDDARRVKTCEQCGRHYHAHRSTSRFCSSTCRLRHHRAPPQETPDVLRQWLLRRGYAGRISVTATGLTVPRALALEDWNLWNPGAAMTDAEFKAHLKGLSIRLA